MNALPATEENYIPFDSDLPSVAAMAAAEVDELLRKETSDLEYLKRLSSIIGQTIQRNNTQDALSFRLIDPVSIDVMSRSLNDFRGAPLQSIDELTNAIYDLVVELAKVQDRDKTILQSEAFLTRLKQFCISLSRYALASKDDLESISSTSEYRR